MYSFREQFSPTGGTASASLHKATGQDLKEVIQQFASIVFKEGSVTNNLKKFCITFPGQFQPYHKGHLITYKLLRRMFGDEAIFILPSENRIMPHRPLTFEQRKKLILNSDGLTLHPQNIRPRRSKGFDYNGLAKDLGLANRMHEYIFICVLSTGDNHLMPVKDKETYYQPWPAELYNASKTELNEISQYLPSMNKYGFRFTVDAFGPEIIFDFKNPFLKKELLRRQFLIELGFNEIRRNHEQNQLDDLQKYLPYDIELLKEMENEYLIEDEEEIEEEIGDEEEIDKEIDLKKDLVQQLNQKEKMDDIDNVKEEEYEKFKKS